MTIEELREKQQRLTSAIRELIVEFEETTGTNVNNVYLQSTQTLGDRLPRTIHVSVGVQVFPNLN